MMTVNIATSAASPAAIATDRTAAFLATADKSERSINILYCPRISVDSVERGRGGKGDERSAATVEARRKGNDTPSYSLAKMIMIL